MAFHYLPKNRLSLEYKLVLFLLLLTIKSANLSCSLFNANTSFNLLMLSVDRFTSNLFLLLCCFIVLYYMLICIVGEKWASWPPARWHVRLCQMAC